MQTIVKLGVFPLAAVFALSVAGVAHAQDAGAQMNVTMEATVRPARPMPLDIMLEKKAQLRGDIRNVREEMRGDLQVERVETRVQMREAATGTARRDIMKESIEDRREIREDARAEIRGTLQERIQALVQTHIGNALQRMKTALGRFDNIIDRIESRIEKLKAAGTDTASVEASLATSASLVATAKADAQAVSDLVISVKAASDTASVKEQLRSTIEKATASIKAAHNSLFETAKKLSALVRASAEADTNATVETN